jgi:hypothetical protein
MKRILVLFRFPNVSLQQYDAIWADLRAAGFSHPEGAVFHVGAATDDGGLTVVDVWESQEAFDQFGKTLMPLLAKHDLPMIQPQVLPAHLVVMAEKQTETA